MSYLTSYFSAIGLRPGAIFLIALLMLWSAIWKILALWKSARKGSVVWFIILAISNTLGILPILYIYVFSEMKKQKTVRRKRRR